MKFIKIARSANRGFTMVETLIAIAIGAIAIAAAFQLIELAQRQINLSTRRISQAATLQTISGFLQKFISNGDLHFYDFSGRESFGDKALGRALIPQPGLCRDLSSCPDDTSLIYAHMDYQNTPSLTVLCPYNDDSFLVDLRHLAYGTGSFSQQTSTFTVSTATGISSGKIVLKPNQIFATLDPPSATLWYADRRPVKLNVTQASDGTLNMHGNPPLSSECLNNLLPGPTPTPTPTAGPLYEVNGLVRVFAAPLILSNLTGGTAVSLTERRKAYPTTPARLLTAEIRSVGKLNIPASGNSAATSDFGIRDCVLGSNGQSLDCNGSDLITYPDVATARVLGSYSLRLGSTNRDYYEFKSRLQSTFPDCQAPDCVPLVVNNSQSIPVLLNTSESYQNLDPSGFSLFKQEVLHRLRFYMIKKDRKVEHFDVQLQ